MVAAYSHVRIQDGGDFLCLYQRKHMIDILVMLVGDRDEALYQALMQDFGSLGVAMHIQE